MISGMPPPSRRLFEGLKILVVDDEADLVEILAEDFSQYGAEVFAASSAQQALEVLHRESVTVILSDVRMPGMDGMELLREVRRRFPTTPPYMFLLSGFADLNAEQTLAMGGQALLPKPFDLGLLRRTLAQLLKSNSAP